MSKLPYVVFGPEIWSLQSEGGISRYFQELFHGLSGFHIKGKILANDLDNSRLNGEMYEGFQILNLDSSINPYTEISTHLSQNLKQNILHPTYYSRNLSKLHRSRPKVVITVFDMISELFPERKPRFRRFIDEKKDSVDHADHILTISQQTKKDLMNIYGVPEEKITVTYLGTNLNLFPEVQSFTPTSNSYILYVGKRGGYKNFENFISAYSGSRYLKSNFSIVAIGGGKFSSREFKFLEKLGVEGKIHQANLEDSLLAMYYRNAACLVYPSLYEGFGLPPVEAMSLNCPVLASTEGSIPEICNDAAQYFDPRSIESIRHTLEVTLQNELLMNEMRKKGLTVAKTFTWENTAKETLNAYQKVIDQ